MSGNDSRFVPAPPEAVYAAFLDADALVAWLPPGNMTGRVHALDAREGGGYRMSLFYPPDASHVPGKTSEHEDVVNVRFVELAPPRRIVEAVTFDADDPALRGEMTITVTLEPAPGGTTVAMRFANLPPGLRPEDNDEGTRLSLAQLARHFGAEA